MFSKHYTKNHNHYKKDVNFCRRKLMTQQRRKLGNAGEQLAVLYLQNHGYGIIAQNWRCSLGEIDIIATDEATLIFVEVRTRRSSVAGLAEESITHGKQRRLAALAHAYLQQRSDDQHPWMGPWRIDVVTIQLDHNQHAFIRHLQHAVEEC
jgi:putative endonuclease